MRSRQGAQDESIAPNAASERRTVRSRPVAKQRGIVRLRHGLFERLRRDPCSLTSLARPKAGPPGVEFLFDGTLIFDALKAR